MIVKITMIMITWYYMIWYDIWYDMIWYHIIWCDVIWYMTWHDKIYEIWYDMTYDMVNDMTCDVTWRDTTRHGMTWNDQAWHGMIWHNMIMTIIIMMTMVMIMMVKLPPFKIWRWLHCSGNPAVDPRRIVLLRVINSPGEILQWHESSLMLLVYRDSPYLPTEYRLKFIHLHSKSRRASRQHILSNISPKERSMISNFDRCI